MLLSRYAIVMGMIGLLHAAPARAEVLDFAGRVIETEGNVVVVHPDGRREAAEYPMLLHGGDQFEFTGHGRVRVNIYGTESDITDQSAPQDRMVPRRAVGHHAQEDETFLEELSDFLSHARSAIPYFNIVRTYVENPSDEEKALKRKLAASPFAPGGVAFVLPGTRAIALVWKGAPTMLSPKAGGRQLPVIKTESVWATLPWPADKQAFEVATEDRKIVWNIRFATAVPCPSWIDCRRANLSDVERVSRAYWILKQGDNRWRVFAVSELADLAEHDNFIAQQLWSGVLSGDLAGYMKDKRE